MTVKEFMKSPVITIRHDASIREAVGILSAHGISGLPVVDDKGDLVGIISEHDIISYMLPTYQDLLASDSAMLDRTILQDRVIQVRDDPVGTIMVKNVVSLDENTDILTAASTIILKKIKRIPVLCGKKPIGIVSRIDILQAVMQGRI